MTESPGRIRLIVLNFNGGDHVLRCVHNLHHLDWPSDQIEIVVVDNASSDGSAEQLAKAFPYIKLLRLPTNDGFPANNLAMRDLRGIRYVGLINNDAFVERGFLGPLVETLDGDTGLGAASPLILFESRFVDVDVSVSGAKSEFGDQRELGVCVSGLTIGGLPASPDTDVWRGVLVPEGGHGRETSRVGTHEWTAGSAVLRIPVPRRGPVPTEARVLVSAPRSRSVTLATSAASVEVTVGRKPQWVTIALDPEPVDVVNNAGSIVYSNGYGADRGMGEVDTGQFADPVDLFAWCGGAVLLRPEYLKTVGLFDERFFLYYEDTDLSWRGRSRGWRFRFVPESRVFHMHATSSEKGSERFHYFNERNHLAMLVKNAPGPMVRAVIANYFFRAAGVAVRDVVLAMLRGRRANTAAVSRRIRAFWGFIGVLPAMLVARRRIRRRQVVPDDQLMSELIDVDTLRSVDLSS